MRCTLNCFIRQNMSKRVWDGAGHHFSTCSQNSVWWLFCFLWDEDNYFTRKAEIIIDIVYDLGEVGAPLNLFKPSSKIFYWPFQGGTSFVGRLCFFLSCVWYALFICALWSPAGKGLTSWLSCVVSSCKFVTFPLVSLVSCGTWLYRFLIFAP